MKKLITLVLAIVMGLSFVAVPAYAAKKGDPCKCPGDTGNKMSGIVTVDTSILSGCDCPDENDQRGKGGAVMGILRLVVEILTVSIGALATVGLGISGIQYLTAGGNEERTRKAKRRIFEIVLGLAVYIVIYAILYFLVPDFKPFS